MQKLILPFQKQMMLCGYKNPEYTKHWGYPHYGIDISAAQAVADKTLYASGEGIVIACGFDNSGGNVIVVLYKDCYNHSTGKSCDLIARYMHLASIDVSANQKVTTGQILGVEGNTKTGDFHLHLEFDTDTAYSVYSPQVSGKDDNLTVAQGNILHKGTDTTVNPSHILHIGDGQVIVNPTYNPAWLNSEDFTIPMASTPSIQDYKTMYDALKTKHDGLIDALGAVINKYID